MGLKVTPGSTTTIVRNENQCPNCLATESAEKVKDCVNCRWKDLWVLSKLTIATKKLSGVDVKQHHPSPATGMPTQAHTPNNKGRPFFSDDDNLPIIKKK